MSPFADADRLRDALVSALLTPAHRDDEPAAVLLARADDATLFVTEEAGELLVLLPWRASDPPDRATLQHRLDEALARLPPGTAGGLSTYAYGVVVIGAPPFAKWSGVPVRSLVFPRPIQWCALSLDGAVTHAPPPFGDRPDNAALLASSLAPLVARARQYPVALVPEVLDAAVAAGIAESLETAGFRRAAHPLRQWSTLALAVANVALFVAVSRWSDPIATPVLVRAGGVSHALVVHGEWWRLVTAGYLHAGFAHVGGNVVGLLVAAPVLEASLGRARLLVLATACIVGGNAIVVWLARDSLAVGASGAVLGLTAALGSVAARRHHLLPETGRRTVRGAMILVVAVNMVASVLPDVSFAAHFGGILVGLLAVWTHAVTFRVPHRNADEHPSRVVEGAWRAGAVACIALTVACFVFAWRSGRPWELRDPTFVRVPLGSSTVSIEVPRGTDARAWHGTTSDDWVEYGFGDRDHDPALVALSVHALDATVPDDGLDEATRSLRDDIESHPTRDRTRRGAVRVVTVGSRPWVYVDQRGPGDERVERWLGYAGDRQLDLEVTHAHEMPDAWPGLGERVLRSVQRIR